MKAFEEFFVEVFSTATNEMASFKFDRYDNIQRTLVSLYATIYEEADAAYLLFQNNKFTGASLIQRPMLEAHVDLLNLAQDKGYIDFMEASHDHEFRRLMEAGLKGTNPFLKGYWGNTDVQKKLAEVTKRLDTMKQNKIQPLRVSERFAKANMTEEYESAYNQLCCDTHNNIRVLQERHIEMDGKGSFQIVINGDPSAESVNSLLDGMIGILLTSSFVVHDYFESAALPKFEDLRKRREELIKGA